MKSNRNAARCERRAFSAEFKAEAVRLVTERRAEGATLASYLISCSPRTFRVVLAHQSDDAAVVRHLGVRRFVCSPGSFRNHAAPRPGTEARRRSVVTALSLRSTRPPQIRPCLAPSER